MEKKINLEEIIANAIYNELEGKGSDEARRAVAKSSAKSGSSGFMKEMMLEFGKQLLALAAENAEYETEEYYGEHLHIWVNKKSILDTIKQVEV